jgi:lysophospholipase L1-like esterase
LLSFALNTRKKDSYIKFNVINAGLEGSTSFDELQLYLYKVRYLKPDVVVLHSGGNDAIYMSQQEENYSPDFSCVNNYDFTIKPAEGWGRYLYRSNIISLIHIMSFYRNWQYFNELDIARGRKSCPSIWFDKSIADVIADSSFANYHFYHNYKTLVRALKDDGVQVISIPFLINEKFDIGNYAHYNEVNNQIIKKISLQEQTIYVNLSKADIPDSYYIDDCHLNGNGNKLKANVIADKILSDIQ